MWEGFGLLNDGLGHCSADVGPASDTFPRLMVWNTSPQSPSHMTFLKSPRCVCVCGRVGGGLSVFLSFRALHCVPFWHLFSSLILSSVGNQVKIVDVRRSFLHGLSSPPDLDIWFLRLKGLVVFGGRRWLPRSSIMCGGLQYCGSPSCFGYASLDAVLDRYSFGP